MFFDLTFILATTFFISFAWLRYYVDNNLICLFLSISISILCFLGIKTLFFNKKHKKQLKKQEQKLTETLANHLSFLSYKETLCLFEKLPQLADKDKKVYKNTISFCHDSKSKMLVFEFDSAPLTPQKFCEIAKNNTSSVLEVFAVSFDKKVYQLASQTSFETKLFDKTDVYFLLRDNNLLPPLDNTKQNVLRSNFLYIVFDKSRAKYYLMSSLFLILTSFLTFFRLYYVITGTILFFVAIYAKFNSRFNHGNHKNEI